MTTAVLPLRATEDPKDVDEVILILQSEQLVLTKDKTGHQSKYADLVQVNEIILSRLNDLRTIWTCRPHLEDGTFGLHYSLRHVPSSTEKTGVWPLKLSDNPQQMGSATTYGRRYALLAVTGVVSEGEDDDGAAASGQRATRRKAAAPDSPPKSSEGPVQPPTTVTMRRRTNNSNSSAEPLTEAQRSKILAMFSKQGISNREQRLAVMEMAAGRPSGALASTNDLTKSEASKVIEELSRNGGETQ